MKKITIFLLATIIIVLSVFMFVRQTPESQDQQDQVVLEKTLKISKEYAALRYLTDSLLIDAEDYGNYDDWSEAVLSVNGKWEALARDAAALESLALEMAKEKTSYNLIAEARAYSREEINEVFDKAPAGKKIATLAKHLGVDAKLAYAILKQEQNETQAEVWNNEGDTFQKLENAATVVKDGCKVVTFVGTIVLTGGTAGLAASGVLAKTAVVVAGADLTLEVTSDSAKIALGDKNKISSIADSARVVTEPAAAILMISTLPSNLTKGIDKLGAVTFGADSLNSAVQDGKVIGIKLPAYTKEPEKKMLEVAVLEKSEVEQWAKEEGVSLETPTKAETENILGLGQGENQQNDPENVATEKAVETGEDFIQLEEAVNQNSEPLVGIWEGILKYTPNQSEGEKQQNYVLELRIDGTVGGTSGDAYDRWEQIGKALRLIISSEAGEGYDEFSLSGDNLTYIKRAGINSEGEWQEDFAGSDFFGGKFMEINLKKL